LKAVGWASGMASYPSGRSSVTTFFRSSSLGAGSACGNSGKSAGKIRTCRVYCFWSWTNIRIQVAANLMSENICWCC